MTMLVLAGFTVWRAAVTAWRPTPNRYYFFPNDTALGLIDRSWLNDFLLGPGTVACFFVAFTLLYAAGGLLHQESAGLFISNRSDGNDSSWSDHRRLIKIILWGLLARALIEAWCEEVGVFASRSVFDPWDLTIELGGIIFGAWLVQVLSYPLFSKAPHFTPGEPAIPGLNRLPIKFSIDGVSAIVTGIYIFIVDPFELRPLTLFERQTLAVEIAIMFITFRAGLTRGMNLSSDSVPEIRSHYLQLRS